MRHTIQRLQTLRDKTTKAYMTVMQTKLLFKTKTKTKIFCPNFVSQDKTKI